MRKATPLIFILILAVTAITLSLRAKHAPNPPVAAPVVAVPKAPAPTPAPPVKPTQPVKPPEPVDPPEPPHPVAPPKVEDIPIGAIATARQWPQAASDIAPDPAITFGTLDNGLRYIIQPNSEPPARVSLRLHIAAGSLMEADDQRGLAHFMEHMVFNGTKHFTADDLVPRMQRLGIGFGAHVNASTWFDETIYMLDLPDLSQPTMELAFTVMRDFCDGALLDPNEIDKERGVILSEKISRDSVEYRLMEQEFAKILPDSLISRRFPIGLEDIIKSAPRPRLADFYTRNYTPDRITFVVVGDVKPADIRDRITRTFASMKRADLPPNNPDLGKIHPPVGIKTAVFSDKEVPSTEVALTLVKPHPQKTDTTTTRTENLPLEIAHSIIGRRFERLSKLKNSPVAEGSATREILFNALEIGSISITAADDRWQDVVPVIEREFRRALEFGFSATELTEAKSNLLNRYQQEVQQESTRKSDDLADEIIKSINEQSVLSSPETDLEIAKRILAAIDSESCHKAFKKFWDAPGYFLILTTKDQPANAETDLASLFAKSRDTTVEAPAARAIQVFDYADFGKPGTVTSRKEVADLRISQCILSNKIRVNLKRTDFEHGKIRLLARIGSGKLSQPKATPMLDDVAAAVLRDGGLGKHSNDDLQQILAGKNVTTLFNSTLTIGDDAFTLEGTTTPADFLLQCQIMCASITDPGYREDALWQFKKSIPVIYQKLEHTPEGPQQNMDAWLHDGNYRYAVAPSAKLSSYTLADVKKWLTPEFTKGYIELSVIGDFDPDTALTDLLATFGALPARDAAPPAMADARKIKFPNAPASKSFTYQSKIAQAVALTVWKTPGIRGHQKEFRRFNLLADILGDRMREEIREKLGASYSPLAEAAGSDALDNFGYVIAESIGKPTDLDLLSRSMRDLADQLANHGATADELDRALKPTLGQLDKSLRDNTYWLTTVMSQSQTDPNRLELARTRDADYRSITLKEINTLAKKYLAGHNALSVTIRPAEGEKKK